MDRKVVIVGGGQAACSCAFKLRALDPNTDIVLLCDEVVLPYQRPPLSKGFVKGQVSSADLVLRTADAYAENRIDVRLGVTVQKIDPSGRSVSLISGETVDYDTLVIATGSRPRPLPAKAGGDLPGVHMLRSVQDAEAIRAALGGARKAVIVGGGYVGLEAAAVFRELGLDVTLVESGARILQRVASDTTSAYFRELHRQHGVDLREGVMLHRLEAGSSGRFECAVLDDGSEITADIALIGIGGIANAELAEEADLDVDAGIVVDAAGRTSAAGIYACGDCAVFSYGGRRTRLESVQNAVDQAELVARAILSEDVTYEPVPWFWSDQYETKLQIAGLSAGYTNSVKRPGKRPGSLSVWYFDHDRLIAVDAMNDPQSYMLARRALQVGHSPDPDRLSDPAIDLKQAVGL